MFNTVKNTICSTNGKMYAGMTKESILADIDAASFKSEKEREKTCNKQIKLFNYANNLVEGEVDDVISEKEIEAYNEKEKTKNTWKTIGFVAAGVGIAVTAGIILKNGSSNKLLKNISLENINKSICEDLKIGEGTEAKVYRIKNTDYILRMPLDKNFIEDGAKISLSVSEQERINHCVATIGDCQILKYIEGLCPQGYITSDLRTGAVFNENITKNEQIKKCIIEKLSLKQMKKYYLQLADADRYGMRHDYVGDNSIINLKNGDLIAIDFVKGKDKKFFNSLMAQLDGYINLNTTEQNNLLKNALRSLLELIKEGKIKPSEVQLSSSNLCRRNCFPKIKDENYFELIKNLVDSYNQDNSIKNINFILSQLK